MQLKALSDMQYLVYEALQKQTLTLDEISKIVDRKQVMPLVFRDVGYESCYDSSALGGEV